MDLDKIKQIRKEYKVVFGSEEGKRILKNLKFRCHYYIPTHVRNDSHESAFLEGQRSVLLTILSFIKEENKQDG